MSQNDIIHLEAHYKNWLATRGAGLDKNVAPFTFYCLDQFLKRYDLSDEEIISGIVDGQLDGGMDAVYFLVDRELVREDSDVNPKTAQTVELLLFQIKDKQGGFQPTEIDKAVFFVEDLLDLTRDLTKLHDKYNRDVLALMALFHEKYAAIASAFPKVSVRLFYITRADEETANASAKQSASRVKAKVSTLLPKAECDYTFVNAQVLLEQIQAERPTTRQLRWADSPIQTDEGQVGFVTLRDYYGFITEGDELERRLFESNVRGWQGDTQVNEQIRSSLKASTAINFWLLNNGITVLASHVGGSKRVQLKDPRVVNGLQTSRAIYDYFKGGAPSADQRRILVRVIETTDTAVFDAVVRATNSQNKMPPASLRGTDQIHRQIEELFRQFDLYYDRRKGVHKDEGRPVSRIVAVSEVLQALVAIALQRPDDARARPGIYITRDDKYGEVFGPDSHDLREYLKCVQLMRRVDSYLGERTDLTRGDRRNIRYYVAAALACRLTNSYPPDPVKLVALDAEKCPDSTIESALKLVWTKFEKLGPIDAIAKGTELLKKLSAALKRELKVAAKAKK
jgi:hypothetical protein